jgi:gluconokinase
MNKKQPVVFFLFGLAGAGKSYVGDLIAKHFNLEVYHADADLLPEMREAIKQKQAFTDRMRDRYFEVVAKKINERIKTGDSLVVTQAAYKKRHRDYLAQQVQDIKFIYIKSPDELIFSRLLKRGDHVTADYAQVLRVNFEAPEDSAATILNVGSDSDLIEQFKSNILLTK